jgi:hypothetical protein
MSQIKHLCIVLIASTLLVLGPVLSCCAGVIGMAHSSQAEITAEENSLPSVMASDLRSLQMPCHEMTMDMNEVDNINNMTHQVSDDAHHCSSSDACMTTMAQENQHILAAHALAEVELEPLYSLVLLEFPKARPTTVSPERPPDHLHPSPLTPITLHQVLTI